MRQSVDRAACERLGTGRLDAFLELGAGPAWHSVACGQNIPGARAVAVDNSPAMLARARERVASANLESTVAVVEDDMTALDVDDANNMIVVLKKPEE